MTGPDASVQAVRLAVRRDLADAGRGTVLVACSGGADSLALLAATVFETRRSALKVVGTVVDHGLQDGSAAHTSRVVEQMAALGADETASIRVSVDVGARGIEAGAREARYVALGQLAEHFEADQVLLGHTLDDQAETVLLGLTRGSGGRSIAGMRRSFVLDEPGDLGPTPGLEPGLAVRFRRPLLEVTRAQTEAACRAEGIEFWTDPHNNDPRFTRSRIRHSVLPTLESELGPGVAAALARTAEQLREDARFLDDVARQTLAQMQDGDGIDTLRLEAVDAAVRHRVIRLAAVESGSIASELFRVHVLAVADLVTGPGQGKQVQLPGHVTAYRLGSRLRFRHTKE